MLWNIYLSHARIALKPKLPRKPAVFLRLARNVDPLSARDSDRAKRQRENATTFKLCAEQHIASHKASWKNAKQLRRTPNPSRDRWMDTGK